MANRDRHGRAAHADTDGRRRPPAGFRPVTVRRFSQLVGDAVSSLPAQQSDPLRGADLVVGDVPPPGETITLAEFRAGAGAGRPPVLTVYRRPLEARADSRAELEDVLRIAVGEAVARALGITDIDDLFD